MTKLTLTIPALFGDHHTTAVKQLLEDLEGISSIYVSSSTHQVEVDFDSKSTSEDSIKEALTKAGYQEGELDQMYPLSASEGATRHTEAFAEIIRFVDTAPSWQGRPLWPCPGIEYQIQMDEQS